MPKTAKYFLKVKIKTQKEGNSSFPLFPGCDKMSTCLGPFSPGHHCCRQGGPLMQEAAKKKKKLSLTAQIAISLVLGILAGVAMQSIPDIATEYIKPFGTIYLNLIKMIVVPVVVLSITQGIVSLQDVRKVGSIGVKTICFYLITTAVAVTLGLVAANLLQVGAGYTLGGEALTYEVPEPTNLMDTLVNIFPSNAFQPLADATMLQVIVIALFLGWAGANMITDKMGNTMIDPASVTDSVLTMVWSLFSLFPAVIAFLLMVLAWKFPIRK